jgi:hypothetical protein
MVIVATLALGSRPKQGLTRLWAKREAKESHHMLPGVQKVQRMWENEPSHSQVNSHCGSCSPKWISKSSKCDRRGQNPSVRKVLYIIGKLLKCRCLKWACMTHLDKMPFGCDPPWSDTKNIIRRKVVVSPKSGLWWVLWVRNCPWLVLAPKGPKLCTNQRVIWFAQIHVSDWTLVIISSPILEL